MPTLCSLVLANTEELHNRIEVMSTRIRELEEALKQVHGEQHKQPHPLLADTITVITQDRVEESSNSGHYEGYASRSKTDTDTVIDAFGRVTSFTKHKDSLNRIRDAHNWNSRRNNFHEQHRSLRSERYLFSMMIPANVIKFCSILFK